MVAAPSEPTLQAIIHSRSGDVYLEGHLAHQKILSIVTHTLIESYDIVDLTRDRSIQKPKDEVLKVLGR
jgi:hypothetical protein